ncbi:MAG TPA: ornithine cyclodeaminase family protein, partial [Thermoanaerobaculia bacterium]|nr:ornithine cyclodeaminase family protein [Thermoanaerobaculia bacterium]
PDAPGFLGLMPAWRGGERPGWGLKEICVYPDNPKRGLDTHVGAVLLHSADTGELIGLFNASAITAIRTAAVSAVATRLLAREDAKTLVILGTGVQGKSHLRAIPRVRDLRDVRVVKRGEDPEKAVRDADIVVLATSSREPVIKREWLKPGVHINAVGSSIASTREVDAETMAAASLWVDRRESTINESGDYLLAVKDGARVEIRGEIGELLLGGTGRTSLDEITLFKSLGLAIEDLASAQLLHEKAGREGVGTRVEF